MPIRVVADPESGFPGKIQEGDAWIQGIYRMAAYAYGPDEVVPVGIDQATIAELRSKYWDSERQALIIPWPSESGPTYEFGPKLLSQTSDTTVVHVRPEFSHLHAGPPPEACFCGQPSVRHAVEYHVKATAAQ